MKKDSAIKSIVTIAKQNELTIKEVVDGLENANLVSEKSNAASKLFAYLGGIFIFAGVSTYLSMFWSDFGSTAKICTTLGAGLLIYISAIILCEKAQNNKASIPLFLVAAALQCSGIFVAIMEFDLNWDDQNTVIFVFAAMALQYALTFWRTNKTTALLIALSFGAFSCGIFFDKLDLGKEVISLLLGFTLISLSYVIGKTVHRPICAICYFIGSVLFFWASFELLIDMDLDIIFLGISCFMVYISTLAKSKTLLFTSSISLLSYIGYYTNLHFIDSLGWPIALILLGFLLIGVSVLALRINTKYISNPEGKLKIYE